MREMRKSQLIFLEVILTSHYHKTLTELLAFKSGQDRFLMEGRVNQICMSQEIKLYGLMNHSSLVTQFKWKFPS